MQHAGEGLLDDSRDKKRPARLLCFDTYEATIGIGSARTRDGGDDDDDENNGDAGDEFGGPVLVGLYCTRFTRRRQPPKNSRSRRGHLSGHNMRRIALLFVFGLTSMVTPGLVSGKKIIYTSFGSPLHKLDYCSISQLMRMTSISTSSWS